MNQIKPKPNNNKQTAGIIIALVLGIVGAVGIIHHVMSVQDNMERVFTPSHTTVDHSDLQQKLFDKCQKLQDWYRSLDGFERTDYHCDKYAAAWSGLVK